MLKIYPLRSVTLCAVGRGVDHPHVNAGFPDQPASSSGILARFAVQVCDPCHAEKGGPG